MTRAAPMIDHRPGSGHRRCGGASLLEALIALAVTAFGLLALVGVQAKLRLSADVAQQRSHAVRLAEQELEHLRGFVDVGVGLPQRPGFDGIRDAAQADLPAGETNTRFTLRRDVVAQADGLQRAVKVTVEWPDRQGTLHRVVLRDLLARASPALSGIATNAAAPDPLSWRRGRHATIPLRAHDLGSGRSVLKPREDGTAAWLLDNRTGAVIGTCTVAATARSRDLTEADLAADCVAAQGQLLSGVVRFNLRGGSADLRNGTSVFKPVPAAPVAWVVEHRRPHRVVAQCAVPGDVPAARLAPAQLTDCRPADAPLGPFDPADAQQLSLDATDAADPRWPALNLAVRLALSSRGHLLPPQCDSDAPQRTADALARWQVEYACLIHANSERRWAGRTELEPAAYADTGPARWLLGDRAGSYRVCRYTQADSDFTDAADHPAHYGRGAAHCTDEPSADPACRGVAGNLAQQNFLVIDGAQRCPTDTAPDLLAGRLVHRNTRAHQP